MVARVRTAVEKAATLDAAFRNTPERFVHHPPEPPQAPIAVWITPPCKNPERPSLKSKCLCLKGVDTFRRTAGVFNPRAAWATAPNSNDR